MHQASALSHACAVALVRLVEGSLDSATTASDFIIDMHVLKHEILFSACQKRDCVSSKSQPSCAFFHQPCRPNMQACYEIHDCVMYTVNVTQVWKNAYKVFRWHVLDAQLIAKCFFVIAG